MAIYIPSINEFTPSQFEINDLPITGRYLMTGGPGSGKTCIAIRRTEIIIMDNPDANIQTMLFTNALNDFFNDGIRILEISSNVSVWAKWQRRKLIEANMWEFGINDSVPWSELSERILALPFEHEYDHLIIDEVQDFSVSDLKVMSLIANNITLFADPHQRLRDSGVEDIEIIKNIFGIEEDNFFHVKENHRNTKQIINAAASLAPEQIDVNLDEVENTGQKPLVIAFKNEDDEIKFIKRVINNNPDKDIGILHLNKTVLQKLYKEIDSSSVQMLRVNTFDFTINSPKLCTLDAAKGLEFDIVIMPFMTKDYYWESPTNLKRIYVGMTRAKSELIMSYSGLYPTIYLGKIDQNLVQHKHD